MKTTLIIPLVLALPVFAGTTAKQTIAPPPPPCLVTWFAGASVGYLTELEELQYNLHLGASNSCWTMGGWNVSLFGEVGYTTKEDNYSGPVNRNLTAITPAPVLRSSYTVSQMGDALQAAANYYGVSGGYDLQVMPITLNIKFEHQLTGSLNAYFGAGLGAAWVDLELTGDGNKLSDSTWVFTSQVFGGLNYSVAPNFDIYGGARWIYYSDASLSDGGESTKLKLGNDCLLELGLRYKF
ncbi:MAG: hypothetical protein WCO57_05865 [Verrucomicrobiota bacterium]